MTISYNLAPIPFWYLPDDSGKPLGSGKMYTYSSLNLTEYKPVFQDQAGTLPWSQPILFNLNGTAGPFYWAFDDANPEEFYFVQIFDSNDNLVYQINNYPGPSSSGGGTITTNINLNNYIVNNSFLYNQGNGIGQIGPGITNGTLIAPSSHSQFYTPDMIFFNTNPGASDTLEFKKFNLGSNPLTGDTAPLYYLNYVSNAFIETNKGIQFPINPDVNTLEDQQMTFTIWARSNGSGANTLQIYIEQYFGTGSGSSSSNFFNVGSITLTNSWSFNVLQFTIPNVSLFTIGSTGDDGTYLQIRYPTNSNCDIDIAKPCLYLGSNYLVSTLDSNEQINSLIMTPRTGSRKDSFYLNNFVEPGWIYMDNGTIGNASSNATNRANIDTWFLYNTLWNSISNTNCPVFNSSGSPVSRAGSSQADWDANNSIRLPITLSNTIAESSGAHPLASTIGSENNTLVLNNLPDHVHAGPSGISFVIANNTGSDPSANVTGGPPLSNAHIHGVTGSIVGSSNAPFSILQPTIYSTFMIKL